MANVNSIAKAAIAKAKMRKGASSSPGQNRTTVKPKRGFTNSQVAASAIKKAKASKALKASGYTGAGAVNAPTPKKPSKISTKRASGITKRADTAGSTNKMPARGYTQAQLNAAKVKKAAAQKRAVGISKRAMKG